MRRSTELPRSRMAGEQGADAPLALTLLGGFTAEHRGTSLIVRSRKAQALLAYMAISGTAVQSRERLCGLLWSESSEEKARASLRQTLHNLKEDLRPAGSGPIVTMREGVALAAGRWSTDAAELLGRLDGREVDRRLVSRKRLADALLPGFDDLDPSFRIWLLVQRQTLQDQLTRSLEDLMGDAGSTIETIREAARALLNLDPTHEGACRMLMEDYARRGDVAGALKLYKTLWDLLDEEYGTEPSPQTQDLLVRIKNNEVEPAPQPSLDLPPAPLASPVQAPGRPAALAAPAAFVDHPYLIVSDFLAQGVADTHAHLVDGLRQALIAKLVRFREWSVIDSGAADGDGGVPGRSFLVEGRMRQIGETFSLALAVKEGATGRFVWSESISLVLSDWFELEQSLLRKIAAALNVHLSTERLMRTAPAADISLGAYDRWLRGQNEFLSFGADGWERSAVLFQSIIDEAPFFSPAFSGLAQLHNTRHLARPGLGRLDESAKAALRLAQLAVRNDPFDSRAHLAQGWAFAMNRSWEQAGGAFDLAFQLNENDPWTLVSTALGYAFLGRYEHAIENAEQVLTLVPLPPPVHWAYHATLRFLCRDYAGCIVASERAGGAISNIAGWKAAALLHLGEAEKAQGAAGHFVSLMRERWSGGDPDEDDVAAWFLDAFPIRLPADRDRLSDGLRGALGD